MTTKTRGVKVTLVVEPADFVGLNVPPGVPRQWITVRAPDRTINVLLNAKSLRRAVTTIAENGHENVALIVQGKLVAGDTLEEAGIVANIKGAPAKTDQAISVAAPQRIVPAEA